MLRRLSVPEIRIIIARLLLAPIAQPAFVFAWSWWRRFHQAAAANAHRSGPSKLDPQL
jgi:hypothetical protein